MYIIYHNSYGTFSPIIAAYMHLNKLPLHHLEDENSLWPLFNSQPFTHKNMGHLIYQGQDEYKNAIYTIGTKNASSMVYHTLDSVLKMTSSNQEIFFVDTSKVDPSLTHLSIYLSSHKLLKTLGYHLMTRQIIKAYSDISKLVYKTKIKIAP